MVIPFFLGISVTNGAIKDGMKEEEFEPYLQQQQPQQPIQVQLQQAPK